MQILPNQVLQVVGRHTDSYSIDCMRLSHDNQYLITASQDYCKFWAAQDIPKFSGDRAGVVCVEEEEGEGEGGGQGEEEDRQWKRRRRRKRKQRQGDPEDGSHQTASNDFFSDL